MGAELRSTAEQLSAATADAAALGVTDVPAVSVGGRVFHGERALEEAAAYTRARESPDLGDVSAGIAAAAATGRAP
jgi:hypothetical protein